MIMKGARDDDRDLAEAIEVERARTAAGTPEFILRRRAEQALSNPKRAARRAKREAHRERAEPQLAVAKAMISEMALNMAATGHRWPKLHDGVLSNGTPIKGAHAEFFFADAHKAWTATRLIGGVASSGLSLPFGRKNKGAAAINITFADGTAKSYTVKPGPAVGKANKYVTAFNALAAKSD
ncbi:hypothetical protein QOM21_08220 [Streptomyces sp. Pv4-95]|uniref:hypothetical protein n=1 Tax=Streptomyces sp. Pv4-95 TaxID=3049543 RepID=UPI0038917095